MAISEMTVSEQIIQVLDALCEKFGLVIDWTSENVIPYITLLCTKLVTWEIWTSVAWMSIMLLVGIVAIVSLTVNRKWLSESLWEYDVFGPFFIVGIIMLFGVVISVIGTQIFDIIKCVTFPEMYIFEYIQGVINSAS